MSTNTLPTHVQSQIHRLTAAEKRRLAGIIDDCSGATEELYRIKTAAAPVSEWGPARRKFLAALAQLQALVEVPSVLQIIAKEGPDAASASIGLHHLPPGIWRAYLDEQNDFAREALASLKRLIEEQNDEPAPDEVEQYVTLDQAAALVNKSKKHLERCVNKEGSDAPPPDVEGGGGRAHEWRWSVLRPWLEKRFGRKLPERLLSRARRG